MVFASLCECTFERDTEDYERECEDVDESIGHAFHEGAVVVVGTCGRHCGRCLRCGL